MTVDELVELTEALTGGLTVADVRDGHELPRLGEISTPAWALLVRFLGGERPNSGPPPAPQRSQTRLDLFREAADVDDDVYEPPAQPVRKFDMTGIELP